LTANKTSKRETDEGKKLEGEQKHTGNTTDLSAKHLPLFLSALQNPTPNFPAFWHS